MKLKKEEIKAIIFDAGGVLVELNWKKFRKQIQKEIGFSTYYKDYNKKIQDIFKNARIGKVKFSDYIYMLIKENKGNLKTRYVVDLYKKIYKNNKKINKNLLKFLERLKKKYTLYCLTDTKQADFEVNKRLGIFKSFKRVIASHISGGTKTKKSYFTKIFKILKLNPREGLFIDDKLENIRNARKLGVDVVLFKNNKQLFKDLKKLGIRVK